MTIRHPRIACIVPGCGCGSTRYPPGHEIICAKHYRLVDKALKGLRRKALKAKRWELYLACWRKMVRQAIQRDAGI